MGPMSEPPVLRLELDVRAELLNANEIRRWHWTRIRPLARYWRTLAWARARNAWGRKAPLDRARVVVTYHWTDRRRRDPHNWSPTSKALVDGLVDAGLLPDDDLSRLDGPDERGVLGAPKGMVVIEVFEVG